MTTKIASTSAPGVASSCEGQWSFQAAASGTVIPRVSNEPESGKVVLTSSVGTQWLQSPSSDVNRVRCKLSTDTFQMFQFSAIAAGAGCTVLMDTGADRCFLSHAFVQQHNFAVNKGHAVNIELADGKAITALGTCRFKMRLGGMASWVTALVLPEIMPDIDLILGMDWLGRHRARLHCDTAEVQLYDGECWRTLHGVGVAEQVVRHVMGAVRAFMPESQL